MNEMQLAISTSWSKIETSKREKQIKHKLSAFSYNSKKIGGRRMNLVNNLNDTIKKSYSIMQSVSSAV